MRHFADMPVREEAVALQFHNFARSLRGRRTIAGDSLGANNVQQQAVAAQDGGAR